jgi:hypothetical protein
VDEKQAANFRAYLASRGITVPAEGEIDLGSMVSEVMSLLATPRRAEPDMVNSPLYASAVGFHEFFRALTAAGFTEDQALKYMAWASQASH